jgi:hypothetical protein
MAETKKDIEYESIQKEMDMPENEVENFIIDGTVLLNAAFK